MSDKRELRNQYKESKVPMGVFMIKNKVNNRIYVGGSMNLDAAMNRNRFELTMKSHRNKKLLKDWIEFGAENFIFEVIDTIKYRDELNFDYEGEVAELLEIWRTEHQSYGENGYNSPKKNNNGSKVLEND